MFYIDYEAEETTATAWREKKDGRRQGQQGGRLGRRDRRGRRGQARRRRRMTTANEDDTWNKVGQPPFTLFDCGFPSWLVQRATGPTPQRRRQVQEAKGR